MSPSETFEDSNKALLSKDDPGTHMEFNDKQRIFHNLLEESTDASKFAKTNRIIKVN